MSGILTGYWLKGAALALLVIAGSEYFGLGPWIPVLLVGLLPVLFVLRCCYGHLNRLPESAVGAARDASLAI